jgi:hypothetical protein
MAFSALTCVIQANQGWTTADERALGVRRAREALADHRDDPVALRCAGHRLCDGGAARPHFEEAVRLSLFDPEIGHTMMGLSFAHLLAGRPEAALTTSRQAAAAAAMPCTEDDPVRGDAAGLVGRPVVRPSTEAGPKRTCRCEKSFCVTLSPQ